MDVAIPDEPHRAALRRSWAELIRRVYEVDPLVCPRCGAPRDPSDRGGRNLQDVCPRQLADRARRNPCWTEATFIHEALHTLGLGENPPSSQEVTKAVMRQCE